MAGAGVKGRGQGIRRRSVGWAKAALPDAWLVSGCLVQTVWNVLTGRAVDYGISDYDVFYFDPDTSWAAEDAVIRRLENRLVGLGVEIEARNRRASICGIRKSMACPIRS